MTIQEWGIVACGGLGRRMHPATIAVPKAMLPLVDRPLIDYALDELYDAGIRRVVIAIRADHGAIADHVRQQPSRFRDLRFIHNCSEDRGIGHTLVETDQVPETAPFVLSLADEVFSEPVLPALLDVFRHTGLPVAAAVGGHIKDGTTWGVTRFTPKARCNTVVPENRNRPRLAGRYVFPSWTRQVLRRAISASGPLTLEDVLARLSERRLLLAHAYRQNHWDCGTPDGYVAAFLAVAERRNLLPPQAARASSLMDAAD